MDKYHLGSFAGKGWQRTIYSEHPATVRPAGVLEWGKGNNVIAVDVKPATGSNLPKGR